MHSGVPPSHAKSELCKLRRGTYQTNADQKNSCIVNSVFFIFNSNKSMIIFSCLEGHKMLLSSVACFSHVQSTVTLTREKFALWRWSRILGC